MSDCTWLRSCSLHNCTYKIRFYKIRFKIPVEYIHVSQMHFRLSKLNLWYSGTDHSTRASTEVKNRGARPPLPHASPWQSAELTQHAATLPFTFTLYHWYSTLFLFAYPQMKFLFNFVPPKLLVYNSQTAPWSESASELHRPSDRSLSAKCLHLFTDRYHVVSVTDPYGRILRFLDRGSSVVLTRMSGPRSRPTTFFFLVVAGIEPGPPDL
jgi:hypothetical protein